MDIENILRKDELLAVAEARLHNGEDLTVEQLGANSAYELDVPFPPGDVSYALSPTNYWIRFKEEMRLLLCTKDRKYARVRSKLANVGGKSQTVILSSIAAAISPRLGVAAGALVPLCALVLFAVAEAGKNALCGGRDLDVELPKKTKR